MKKFKRVLSVLLAIVMIVGTAEVGFGGLTAFAASGKTIYVSTEGSRSGDGSESNPFASVAAAIAAAADGDTIEVAGGTYYLDDAINFSGKSNITVVSKSGETAVFSGGYNVTGWTSASLNGQSCLSADIPYDIYSEIVGDNGGNAAYGGVFTLYNAAGDMLVNSRFPDTGYRYATAGSGATFTGEAADVSWLSDEVLDKAIVRVDHKWISETSKISGFNASTNQVTLASFGIGCAVGDNYYFENVKHGFDKAGEWYFDYAACRVYYIPKTGETASNVNLILGKEQRLAEITGSSNIKFQNIKFENSNWGYRGYRSQSAIDSVACIRVKNSSGVEFANCTFSNIGNTAVSFGDNASDGRCTNCKVTGCKFTNIGNNAIFVGAGSETSNRCENIEISDNLISGYGKMYHHAAGILATKVYNCNISNNEVHDGNYTAISVGWNWGFMATVTDYNKVNNNLIYNIGHSAICDMGGIYFLGIQQNSEIKNNVVFGVEHFSSATTEGAWGIYLDEGSSGIDVMNNIVHDCGGEGFHQHYGYNNQIKNNIFAFNRASQVRSTADKTPSSDSAITGVSGQQADVSLAEGDDAAKKYYHDTTHGYQFTLENNILVADNGYMYGSFRNASLFSDNNNTYYDYTLGADVVSSGTLTTKAQVTNSGKTNDYSGGKFSNPNFTNAANRDFSFSGSAPSGFTAISTANVGSSTYGSAATYNAVKLKTLNEDYYYEGAEYDAYKAACLTSNASTIASAYNAIDTTNYTITLNANGGSASPASISYNGISTVTLPAATKSGYTFKGWQRADGAIYPQGTYYAGSGSYTMTAVYEVRPAEITSTGSHKFVYFDNLAKLADITVPNTGINVSNVKVDYATNSISFTATGSDCYVQAFDIPGVVTNHKYVIYYDLYVNGARTSNTRMTLNAYNWQTRYLENWANGQEFQAEEGRLELRPGINNNTGSNVTVEYRNIRIMDVAWGGTHDRIPCEEVVRAVPNGSAIGAMPEEPCAGRNFIGWGTVYDNPANGINGTEYTASTVPTSNVILYPGYHYIKAEDATMKVAVPETAYVNPNSKTASQYFVNNEMAADGTVSLKAEATQSTGKIYFKSSEYAGQTITAKLYDGSTELCSKSINLNGEGYGSVTSGISFTLGSALAENTSKSLKWEFKNSSGNLITTAYTTAYSPFMGAVAAFGAANAYKNSRYAVAALSSVIYGIHGINSSYSSSITFGGTTYKSNNSGKKNNGNVDSTGAYLPQPLKNPATEGLIFWNGTSTPPNTLFTTGSGAAETHCSSSTSEDKAMQTIGGTGYVYYDSSRVSYLKDIVNLGMYVDYNGIATGKKDNVDKHELYGDVYTINSSNATLKNKQFASDSSDDMKSMSVAKRFQLDKFGTSTENWGVSGVSYIICKGSFNVRCESDVGVSGGTVSTFVITKCDLRPVDKGSLRAKVAEAIACGLAANDPNNTAYVNACLILGKPNATDAEISSALTALTTAVSSYGTLGATCTATVNYYKNGTTSTVASTETKSFAAPSNVTGFAKEIEGYTLTSCTVNGTAASIVDNKYVVAKKQTANVIFNYYYTPITYKVRFMNGSTLVSEQNAGYKAGLANVTLPTAPTKSGCKFIGWNTEYGLINSDNEALITKDITAYAVFEPVEYSIYYNVNHDSSKDNYLESPVFLTGSSSGVTCSFNSADETVTFNGTLTDKSDDFIEFPVNASQMTAGTYTIALEEISGERYEAGYGYYNGGDHSIEVRSGCIVFEFLTKDGNRFGSSSADRIHVDFFGNPIVTADVTLTQEQINNLGSVSVWMTANGSPNLKLTNYKFKVNLQNAATPTPAIVSPFSQRIMYNEVPGSQNTPTPQRTGYTFGGWYKEAACTNAWNADTAYTKEGNTTLYAKWTPITYTVAYNGNGNTSGSTASSSHTYDVAKALTANGFTKGVTVTFDATTNGGSCSTASLPSNYSFLGWANSETGDKVYNNSQSVTNLASTQGATVNLYAKWGTTLSAVTLPTPNARTGYTFNGWYTAASGGTKAGNAGASYTPTGAIKLYAQWTKDSYTISYDLAGGTVATANPTTYAVDTATFTLNNPTKAGYTFAGWTGTGLSSASTSVSIAKGSTGNRSYTATWTKDSYTISYDLAGGTATGSNPASYNIETATITLSNPTKAEYAFTGWTLTGATFASGSVTSGTTATIVKGSYGNVTATANWEKIAKNDSFVIDAGVPVILDVLANDMSGATLTSVSGDGATIKSGKIEYTPGAIYTSVVTISYTATLNGVASAAEVKLIPASTVYYEETFVTFKPADKWVNTNGSTDDPVAQAIDALKAGDALTGIYGANTIYNADNSAKYSFGNAKKTTISSTNNNNSGEINASFTFTGTGFEIGTVLSANTGNVKYTVLNKKTNVKKTYTVSLLNGYEYGQLYLNGNALSFKSGTALYTDGKTVAYKNHGVSYYSDGTNAAYGWLPYSDVNNIKAIYQAPAIYQRGLDYGEYEVTIIPRFTAKEDIDGSGSCDFYLDSVKIYNPVSDPENPNEFVEAAYLADGEYDAHYKTVREILVDAQSIDSAISLGDNKTAGIAYLGSKYQEDADPSEILGEYQNVGPKNEVYLEKDNTIAFKIEALTSDKPSKIALGVKLAYTGAAGTISVNGSEINVTVPTEQYVNIFDKLVWVDGANGKSVANVIITNEANAPISLTDIKYPYKSYAPVKTSSLDDEADSRELLFYFDDEILTLATQSDDVEPEAANVLKVDFEPAADTTNTYQVTVKDRANMIQFMELDHGDGTGTRSFDRHNENVTIVSYDKDGNRVSSTSKDLAYEVWTVTTKLADGNIGVRVKEAGSSVWEDVSDAYRFVNEYAELDSDIISATLAKTEGKKGSVKATVVAGADTQVVQFKNKEGETFTFDLSKSAKNEDGTLTFNCSVYFHGTSGTVNTATIRVYDSYGWHDSDVTVEYKIK